MYNNILQHNTHHSRVCRDDFTKDKAITRNSRKMRNHCYRPAAQGFEISHGRRAVKFREMSKIHKNTHGRSLTKYMSVQHIWDLSWLMGLFFAVNLQIYLKTSSLHQENVPKLPGVLWLLLRKTGHWPVHDIKSSAIGTFLRSLLLKELMMISD